MYSYKTHLIVKGYIQMEGLSILRNQFVIQFDYVQSAGSFFISVDIFDDIMLVDNNI